MDETESALERALHVERSGEARFSLRVQDGWQQGRGAFGGLVLGAMLRAAEATEPDPGRSLRSLAGEIVAPVLVGEAGIAVEPLRIGSGVSTWTVTLTQGDQAAARVSVVLGRRRSDDHRRAPAPPGMGGPWQDVPEVSADAPEPRFIRHFERRSLGPLPFSGSDDPEARGWIRPRAARVTWDAATVLAAIDAWWPGSLAREPAPRPVATVAFTLQLFSPDPPPAPEAPLFYRGRGLAAEHGFEMEMRELWTPDGGLVALNQQTFVWIK